MSHPFQWEYRKKWDSKSDSEIFLGYSSNSQAYRVLNNHTRSVMKSINVVIDDQYSDQVLDDDRDNLVLFPDVFVMLPTRSSTLIPMLMMMRKLIMNPNSVFLTLLSASVG